MLTRDNQLPVIRCRQHVSEYYTNYCCRTYKPLCPECIDDHIKNQIASGGRPEVDTLKKVRDMCSLKTLRLAKLLEDELKKLGLFSNRPTEYFLENTLNNLEDTRRKLHRFIDEYLDILKSSLYTKYNSQNGGVLSDMRTLITYVQSEIDKLYSTHNMLKGDQMLQTLEGVCKLDSEDLVRRFKEKLMKLRMESELIDVKLDEDEMIELGSVLRKIISLDSKKVQNYQNMDKLIEHDLEIAEPPAVKSYFDHKFNTGKKMYEILQNATPFVKGNDVLDTDDFFFDNRFHRIMAKVLPKKRLLSIIHLKEGGQIIREDIDLPTVILPFQNSSHVVQSSGKVFISGGMDSQQRASNKFYRFNPETKTADELPPMNDARGSHSMCVSNFEIFAFGGRSSQTQMVESFEKFDVLTSRWERLPGCSSYSVRSLLIPFNQKYIYKIGGISSRSSYSLFKI